VEKDKISSLPFGHWGEDIASEYLQKKGYQIIDKHFYFQHGEIDIIARDRNYLVFIEVKTRSSVDYGLPEEAVTPKKRFILRRAAEGYLYVNDLKNIDCRFDVVTVTFGPDGLPSVEHIENAFE
jgi:putative endonuclease